MAKRQAIPTRLKPQDVDRHRVAIETLGESSEAIRVAHVHLGSRLGELTTSIEKGEADLATAKAAAVKALEKVKAEMLAKRRKTLDAATDAHRKTSGLLDELLARLARAKDTLA